MLWFWEAEVFPRPDYGPATKRCGNLDLDRIRGDVRREDPEATPPLFCHYLCLVLRLAKVRLALDGAQGLLVP
jgi:hypothetical protein